MVSYLISIHNYVQYFNGNKGTTVYKGEKKKEREKILFIPAHFLTKCTYFYIHMDK